MYNPKIIKLDASSILNFKIINLPKEANIKFIQQPFQTTQAIKLAPAAPVQPAQPAQPEQQQPQPQTNTTKKETEPDDTKDDKNKTDKARLRKRKCFFEVGSEQKRLNRRLIHDKLDELNKDIANIGLHIDSVNIVKRVDGPNKEVKLNINNKTADELKNQDFLFKTIMAKDCSNLSERNYKIFRSTLGLSQLPTLKRLTKLKKNLNSIFKLSTNAYGAFVNPEEKIKFVIKQFLIREKEPVQDDTFIIKFSGDSTNITKANLKILNFAFTLINEKQTAKTSKGNYMLGVFKIEQESYDELKGALKELLELIEKIECVEIDGKSYKIKKCIGGDLKFLASLYGLNSANSYYPCVWCECHKKEFYDLTKNWSIKNRAHGARSLEKAYLNHSKKSINDRKGQINEPIIKFIDFDSCVIDLLHLFLRITDVLVDSLLENLDDDNETGDLEKRPNLKKLIEFLTSECKISKPFYLKNVNNKLSLKLRTLNGSEKLKMFQKLIIKDLFPDVERLNIISDIWIEFENIYTSIKRCEMEADELKERLFDWLNLFLTAHAKKDVTPYIHSFVFHLPEFVSMYNDVNLFNIQGLEKLNDITTKYYHFSTNRHSKNNKFLIQMMEKRNRIEYYSLHGHLDDVKGVNNDGKNDEDD